MIDLPRLTSNFGGLANTKSAGINGAEEETKTALTFPPVVTNPAMLHFLPSFPSPSCLCKSNSIFTDRSCYFCPSIFHQIPKVLSLLFHSESQMYFFTQISRGSRITSRLSKVQEAKCEHKWTGDFFIWG